MPKLASSMFVPSWLKSSIILVFAATLAFCGAATFADVEMDMEMGVNYYGYDYRKIDLPVGDPALCRKACDDDENTCVAWTFVKPGTQGPSATCYLKNRLSAPGHDPNVISGRSPGAGGPNGGSIRIANGMMLGIDVNGADLSGGIVLPRGDPALCETQCTARGDCQAWTFVKPGVQNNNALCFLKRAGGTEIVNGNTISGRHAMQGSPVGGGGGGGGRPTGGGTVPALPAVGTPAAGTGFGVWAYVVGVDTFDDPCTIQYVAAAIPSNRYDANPRYRRVRARFTMGDASNDVTFFSLFMQDQPDQVVKLQACSPNTAMLPPRTGGPGAIAARFAVWAYVVGVQDFSDPCSIQYVKAPILGNRFDGNPRYRRVAEEVSDSEASNLITRFSAFMQDQGDGVVKLRPCHDDTEIPLPPVTPPPLPPAVPTGIDIAGSWRGANGTGDTYSFAQNGTSFRWTRSGSDEVGTGTIDGTSLGASYRSSGGSGSAGGTLELGPDGRPIRIRWSNGDTYLRQ